MNTFNLVVVIPAFNEEATIGAIVTSVRDRGYDVIVVDDGSTDSTAGVATIYGAQVLKHIRNLGYERALCTGVHVAASSNYELVVTFDADGQLEVDDVVRFAEIARSEDCDVVIGVRDYRNRISEYLLVLYGKWRFGIQDPLCGMKLYRLTSASPYFPFDQAGLVGMELAFRMAAGGCRINEAFIHASPRLGDSRFGSSLQGNLKILRALFASVRIFGWVRNSLK